MKIYEFTIRQLRVKNIKDALILMLKLFVVAIIADEIYNAAHILPCLQTFRDKTSHTFFYCLKEVLFFLIIYVIYRLAKRFKRKGTLKKAVKITVIIGVLMYLFNGSLLGIYYFNGPYWGRVVDANTGEPIVGANVMAKWVMESMAFVAVSRDYADARETVTDAEGRFIVQPARRIWLWPFSWMSLENLYVYKPGYDSHPPSMHYAWSDADKKKWKKKLVKIVKNYDQESTVEWNYNHSFLVNPKYIKFYEPIIIRLNRALSNKEKKEAVTCFSFSSIHCGQFKVKKFKEIVE